MLTNRTPAWYTERSIAQHTATATAAVFSDCISFNSISMGFFVMYYIEIGFCRKAFNSIGFCQRTVIIHFFLFHIRKTVWILNLYGCCCCCARLRRSRFSRLKQWSRFRVSFRHFVGLQLMRNAIAAARSLSLSLSTHSASHLACFIYAQNYLPHTVLNDNSMCTEIWISKRFRLHC